MSNAAERTLTLTEFLLARIAEDEANPPEPSMDFGDGRCGDCGGPSNRRWMAGTWP